MRQYIYFWVDREEKPREIGGGWRDCQFGSGFMDVSGDVEPGDICARIRDMITRPNANVTIYQADAVACFTLPENSQEVHEEMLTIPMTSLISFSGENMAAPAGLTPCAPANFFRGRVICEKCGIIAKDKSRVQEREETLPVNGEPVTYMAKVRFCGVCGEDIFDEVLDGQNLQDAYAIYNKRHSLAEV